MRFERVTTGGPSFVYWAILWGCGFSFTLVYILRDIFAPIGSEPLGRDFANVWTVGKLALDGQVWLAYDLDTFRLALNEYVGNLTLHLYSYPPPAVFIGIPFALLPYIPALILWTVLGMAFFAWAAKPYTPFSPILAALTPAAANNILAGHYGFLHGGLWLLFFASLHNHPRRAGLVASAMTFKPHLGLFIALAALSRRQALVAALVGTATLICASILAFGLSAWFGFFATTVPTQGEILINTKTQFGLAYMPSAYVVFGRGSLGIVAQVVISAAALLLLYRHWTLDPFPLATATFLIVPYAFGYDMTVACLGFAVTIYTRWSCLTAIERWALSAAFLAPILTFTLPYIVPFALLAALRVQLNRGTDAGPGPMFFGRAEL